MTATAGTPLQNGNPILHVEAAQYHLVHGRDWSPPTPGERLAGEVLLHAVLRQDRMEQLHHLNPGALRFVNEHGRAFTVAGAAEDLHALRSAHAILKERYPHLALTGYPAGGTLEADAQRRNADRRRHCGRRARQALAALQAQVELLSRRGFAVAPAPPRHEPFYAHTQDEEVHAWAAAQADAGLAPPDVRRVADLTLQAVRGSNAARLEAGLLREQLRGVDTDAAPDLCLLHQAAQRMVEYERRDNPHGWDQSCTVVRDGLHALERLLDQLWDLREQPQADIERVHASAAVRGYDILARHRAESGWLRGDELLAWRVLCDPDSGEEYQQRLQLDDRELDRQLQAQRLPDSAIRGIRQAMQAGFADVLEALGAVPVELAAVPALAVVGQELAP